MTLLRLARLFARRAGANTATAVLPVVAFGVVALCGCIVLGGVHAFFRLGGPQASGYRLLALLALVLLAVPLVSLGGAAARLSARRRDERLSGLRLLGASASLVGALTVLESTGLALLGAVLGVAASVVALPLLGLLHFGGHALGGTIWPDAWAYPAVVGAVVLVSAVSAMAGLRGVVLTPLGVRTRVVEARVRAVRAVAAAVVVVGAVAMMSSLSSIRSLVLVVAVVLVCFGGVLAVIGLVGPLVLRVFARRWLRRAATAAQLLAARAVLDDPRAAWRQVGSVAMVSFVAVFAGVGASVALSVGADADPATRTLGADILNGVVLTLVMSFAMAASTIGIVQAAAVLDRRPLYVGLDRIGMPRSSLEAARSRAVLAPLLVVTIGSALLAAIVLLPLTGYAFLVSPGTVAVVVGALALGIGLVWLGLRATRPVLARVLAAGGTDRASRGPRERPRG